MENKPVDSGAVHGEIVLYKQFAELVHRNLDEGRADVTTLVVAQYNKPCRTPTYHITI